MSADSSIILMRGTFRERVEIRDFCTDVIEQLTTARVATLWVLRDRDQQYSIPEVLKSLILQALSLDYSAHSDIVFSFQLRRFLDSYMDEDYLKLLSNILQHFQKVYIIVDTGAMSPEVSDCCRVQLRRLSHILLDQNAATVIKVIVSSCGPEQKSPMQQPMEDMVFRIGREAPQRRYKAPSERRRRFAHESGALPHAGQTNRRRQGRQLVKD